MKIFGEPWDAPMCEDAEQVETPVGGVCLLCNELVDENDRGVLIPYGGADGYELRPEHAECHMRSILGPPEHHMGWCTCHTRGGVDLELGYREEARHVWRMFMGDRA